MRKAVFTKTYAELPDYDRREILRYAGARGETDERLQALLDECLRVCEGAFCYRVCYTTLTRKEFFALFPQSKTAAAWTEGCEEITVFAATAGLEIDRLIHRYASVSTAKALLLQAIGAERIEELCDVFCAEQGRENGQAQRRFSPGYGDFPLTAQREIFDLLNPSKRIGVSLTDSLLMSPSKSVTAAFGVKRAAQTENFACAEGLIQAANSVQDGEKENGKKCAVCDKKDCTFRKE